MKGLVTAVLTAAGQEVLLKLTNGKERWERSNFRGHRVNLSGGVTVAGAAVAAAGLAPVKLKGPALLITSVAAATGMIDDFDSNPSAAKGLKGHLSALRRGDLTTGAVKLLGISSVGVVAGASIARRRGSYGVRFIFDAVTSGAIIAGAANVVNLLDLRPGRALKATALVGVSLSLPAFPGRYFAGAAVCISAGAAPRDLKETTMLGDVGANSLGALVGLSVVQSSSAVTRLLGLGVVTSLILASEKISFSKVIDSNELLSRIDHLGRRT